MLSNVKATKPNHIWGIDLTYIRLRAGWMYLVAILDWYSRYVVGWELDQTMQQAFVMEAMQRALERTKPQICNSDQGSQFTSLQYTQLLLSHDVRISMVSLGRALDNIFDSTTMAYNYIRGGLCERLCQSPSSTGGVEGLPALLQ